MADLTIPGYIKQEDYDKLSDDVLMLARNVMLRFNVSLSRLDSSKNRVHYHKEFMYEAKALNEENLITLKRSFDYYLTIENQKKDELSNTKEYLIIGVNDMMRLRFCLDQALSWFTSATYDGLFAIMDNELVMTKQVNTIILDNLPMGKYIAFEPTVIEYDNTTRVPGIKMYLSSPANFSNMDVNKLTGFKYTIDTFNMFLSAQNMINYLEKPKYGTNLTRFLNGEFSNVKSPLTSTEIDKVVYNGKQTGVRKRDIPNKNIQNIKKDKELIRESDVFYIEEPKKKRGKKNEIPKEPKSE